jgi:hypothetical protein
LANAPAELGEHGIMRLSVWFLHMHMLGAICGFMLLMQHENRAGTGAVLFLVLAACAWRMDRDIQQPKKNAHALGLHVV